MAKIEQLLSSDLKKIALQISALANDIVSNFNSSSLLKIGESIKIDYVDNADIHNDSLAPEIAVKFSGKWHLQIFFNNAAVLIARVEPDADQNHWHIVSFFESKLANAIQDSLLWMNNNYDDEFSATLLTVSSYSVTTFLLKKNSEFHVLPVDFPSHLEFKKYHSYSYPDFRSILQKKQPIGRVTFSPDIPHPKH